MKMLRLHFIVERTCVELLNKLGDNVGDPKSIQIGYKFFNYTPKTIKICYMYQLNAQFNFYQDIKFMSIRQVMEHFWWIIVL